MASYPCGGCDGAEQAVVLITPLSGADTLAIGPNCMPVTFCGMFAAEAGIDADKLWDAAMAIIKKEAAKAAKGAAPADPPADVDGQAPADVDGQAAGSPPASSPPTPAARAKRAPAGRRAPSRAGQQ